MSADPLGLGFRSPSLADAQAGCPLPTVRHPLSVCLEQSIARHLEGHELELAEDLQFQWSLPPLNYYSLKNKFLNISPQFYAKPQSSI